MPNNNELDFHLMRRREVEKTTGLATGSLYVAMANRTFPRPIRIGRNSVAWLSTEVDAWLLARVTDRDSGNRKLNRTRTFHIVNVPVGMGMLRRPEVLYRTGKSSASLYKDISLGLFPAPISISDNTSAWIESEVNAWIQHRLTLRNQEFIERKTQ